MLHLESLHPATRLHLYTPHCAHDLLRVRLVPCLTPLSTSLPFLSQVITGDRMQLPLLKVGRCFEPAFQHGCVCFDFTFPKQSKSFNPVVQCNSGARASTLRSRAPALCKRVVGASEDTIAPRPCIRQSHGRCHVAAGPLLVACVALLPQNGAIQRETAPPFTSPQLFPAGAAGGARFVQTMNLAVPRVGLIPAHGVQLGGYSR